MLNEEIEHENDIEDWLTDIQRMKVFNVMTGSSVLKNYRKIKWKLLWARSKREIYTQKRETGRCFSFFLLKLGYYEHLFKITCIFATHINSK